MFYLVLLKYSIHYR